MKLYITAKANDDEVKIDFIEMRLPSGEVVSLNWDTSYFTFDKGTYESECEGVYFDEEYADGRLDQLKGATLMALKVFAAIYGDKKESIIKTLAAVEQYAEGNDRSNSVSELVKNKRAYEKKLDKLIELYTDGSMSKEVYLEKKNEYQANIDYFNETIQKMEDVATQKDKQKKIRQIIKALELVVDTTGKKYCDDGIVKNGVDKVIVRTPCEFEWLINISGDANDFTDENYRVKHNSALDIKHENTMKMRDALYFPMFTFIINYEDAKEYRKTWSKYLRTNQWEDIKVSVYIR